MLLDPEINANALNWTQNGDKARTPANAIPLARVRALCAGWSRGDSNP